MHSEDQPCHRVKVKFPDFLPGWYSARTSAKLKVPWMLIDSVPLRYRRLSCVGQH
jgi:hypothetical protein